MNVDEKDLTLLKRLPAIDHIMELLEKDDFFPQYSPLRPPSMRPEDRRRAQGRYSFPVRSGYPKRILPTKASFKGSVTARMKP